MAGVFGRGLSPRVRGSLCRPPAEPPGRGSIPACAGEPRSVETTGCHARVYPRVCGGALNQRYHEWELGGLSPRVRGSPGSRRQHKRGHGSIPACAGEPPSFPGTGRTSRVYPRVCGGAPGSDDAVMASVGLSPRVRGSRCPAPLASLSATVYPRVCGGARCFPAPENGTKGLSPRVRGSPFAVSSMASPALGLSPRVRGSPGVCKAKTIKARSIPACAGEPRSWCSSRSGVWVYPRVCGGARPLRAARSRR